MFSILKTIGWRTAVTVDVEVEKLKKSQVVVSSWDSSFDVPNNLLYNEAVGFQRGNLLLLGR